MLSKVESTARNLKSLVIDTSQYGLVLISIVINQLPETTRLHITYSIAVLEEWNVDDLLEVLQKEINSRELCSYMWTLKKGGNN